MHFQTKESPLVSEGFHRVSMYVQGCKLNLHVKRQCTIVLCSRNFLGGVKGPQLGAVISMVFANLDLAYFGN